MSMEAIREAAIKDLPSPCSPECTERSATCKFDGSCEEYNKWRVEYDALVKDYETQAAERRLATTMFAERHASKRYRQSCEYNRRKDKARER